MVIFTSATFEGILTSYSFLWCVGWLSLVTILDELKSRPAKRGSQVGWERDGTEGLVKRVRGVDLGGL